MPCGCKEKKKKGKFRFIGGRDKPHGLRGPYRSYEPGEIYEMSMRHANTEAYPYWELVEGEITTSAPIEEAEPAELDFEHTDKEAPTTEKPRGLTQAFKGRPPSDTDFIKGMDDETLKNYIQAQGGKVDGRWGRERLVEEALKLQ